MGACVKMQSIHYIIKGKRGSCGFVDLLAPGRGSYEDDGIRLLFPDHRDDFLGIGLDAVPGGTAVGLITDLIEHIVVVSKSFRHFPEKGDRLIFVLIRVAIT